jgi:acetyl esterase
MRCTCRMGKSTGPEAPVPPDRGFLFGAEPLLSHWELGLVLPAGHSLECRGTETYGHKELPMALDDDAARVLEMMRLSGRPAFEAVGPTEARALFLRGRDVFSPDPAPVAEIRDMAAVGPDGAPLRLRLYRGAGTSSMARLPVLMFFHGGGWVVGDLETHDTMCRHIANAAGCAVVAVDYRLAPEHKFPAAVEDCLAATQWVAENAREIGVDPGRLAVGGDSAGGNLAAVVSLIARDRGTPKLRAQLLLYPVLDCGMKQSSHQRFAEGHLLTEATMRWFAEAYLRGPGDIDDWRVSPLRAPDLSGLPPTYVLTAGYDPLCDEGIAYARRLQDAGVAVEHRHVPDQIHGFLLMGKMVRAASPALDEIAAALNRWLEGR